MRFYFTITCLFFICYATLTGVRLSAQGVTLQIDQSANEAAVKLNLPKNGPDSSEVNAFLAALRYELIEDGYLAASFDTVIRNGDTVRAVLNAGRPYKWAKLSAGNVREEMLSKAGYREKFFRGTPFKPAEMSRLFETLLDLAENNGYPFAQLGLADVVIDGEEIEAALKMNLHAYTVIDSIIIKGDLETNRRVIENHLGLMKGAAYNQSRLDRIPLRLRELPYVRVIKPYEVGMREGEADIYLYLENKKASNFDGVLGVLPDPVTGDIIFTGDVTLDLMNPFKRGESINLRWQRLQTRTQQLDLRFAYPFLFNTPVGTEFNINLFRQDTLFSQVNLGLAIQYFLPGGNKLKFYVDDFQANVISASAYQQGRLVDSRSVIFGIGGAVNTLDYRFNPRSGYFFDITAGGGKKRIRENAALDESFYDDVNLRSEIYNANILAGYHQPVGRRATLLFRVRGGYFLNDNMFLNEAYRIGGLKSIRGFDEQAIFATGFAVGTLEFRYLLEENSNVFLFIDQAAYENRINREVEEDTPLGFGGGINFETGAGIFSLTYALGRQFDNDISLRGGKLHFGFVSFF